MKIEKIEERVQKAMDDKRYRHTLGVAYTAASMAMVFDVDIQQAYTAGMLHDCAKQLGDEKLLKLSEKYNIEFSDCERKNPFLLHAKVGSALAQDKYKVDDADIISAIRWHTTGKENMSKLEQIIFLADYIEPGRNKVKELPEIRKEAFENLDECCFMVLDNMLRYLSEKGGDIDPPTRSAYNYYKDIHENKTK